LAKNFDYVEWVRKTRRLMRKHGMSQRRLEYSYLDTVLRCAKHGDLKQAEKYKKLVDKSLRDVYRAEKGECIVVFG
jgi:hypothetical protein